MPNTKIIGISISHNKLKGVKHINKSLEMIKFDYNGKIELYDDFLAGGYCKTNKAQKETIRLQALSQLHKLKKQLAKAKTKKKQAELKRSIRKQQKLIK